MIGIYGGITGERGDPVRLAMTYNGLTLNNPADSVTDTYEINTIAPNTAFDYISEVNQQRDGLEVYPFRKVSRIITLKGTLRAPSLEKLFDKMQALASAFDPARIGQVNGEANMFLPFDFSVPTLDTANFPTGLAASRYYALPLKTPEPVIDYAAGTAAFFDIVLLLRDPRRYLQTEITVTFNTNHNNTPADYPSWPTWSMTMSGAGSATHSITNVNSLGTFTITLDLSGRSAGQVVVVNMERRRITVDGTATPSLYVSGSYFQIQPGSNNLSRSGSTGISAEDIKFRRAFSL